MKNTFNLFGIIAIVTIIGLAFVTCETSGDDTFAKFNGEFRSSSRIWVFNGTNKAQMTFTSSGNVFDCEIKLEDGHFWYRLWENRYSEWSDQGAYSFDNNGNIKIGNTTYTHLSNIIIPNTPTGVSISATSSSSITVNWDVVSDVDGYYVYRCLNASGTYTRVGTSTTTLFTDTMLSHSTAYYYKVSSYNAFEESIQSSYASATTQSPSAAPSTPTGVRASASYDSLLSMASITINWDAVSDIDEYYVYSSSSVSGTYTYIGRTTNTSYTTDWLSRGTTFYYKVSAYNSLGESTQSSYVSATTTPYAPDSAPANLRITNHSYGSYSISWNAVAGATGYRVYYSYGAHGWGYYETSSTTYGTFSCIRGTGDAWFSVSAVNAGGQGPESSQIWHAKH